LAGTVIKGKGGGGEKGSIAFLGGKERGKGGGLRCHYAPVPGRWAKGGYGKRGRGKSSASVEKGKKGGEPRAFLAQLLSATRK